MHSFIHADTHLFIHLAIDASNDLSIYYMQEEKGKEEAQRL